MGVRIANEAAYRKEQERVAASARRFAVELFRMSWRDLAKGSKDLKG